MAEDLIYYIKGHGYVEDDLIWVSHLGDYYYVNDPTTDTFKLTDSPTGDNVEYDSTITDGWVRQVDPTSGKITIKNLGHLEGMQVRVTSVGQDMGTYTVENAQITLIDHVYTYHVGLMYAMKIKSMRFAIPGNGNIQTRIKRINEQAVRYVRTKNIQVGQEYGGKEYMARLETDYSDKSEDQSALNGAGYDDDGYAVVKSVEPFPATILGFVVDIEVTER